jgi:hypothetical protein
LSLNGLATDLGKEHGGTDVNERDGARQLGRLNLDELQLWGPSVVQETATGQLITQRSRICILSSLPAKTRPEGFAPGGCHAAREHGSTLSGFGAAAWCSGANDGLDVWLPAPLGPLIRASFVRTLRSRPQRNPVRFTSYPATTRMRRSRSNVLHSARGSAYAAGQRHSLPPHTRKGTGSIPVGTTRNAEVGSCLVGWSPLAIAGIRQNPPRVDVPLDYLKVCRGTGSAPHSTCGHRRRPETVESQ